MTFVNLNKKDELPIEKRQYGKIYTIGPNGQMYLNEITKEEFDKRYREINNKIQLFIPETNSYEPIHSSEDYAMELGFDPENRTKYYFIDGCNHWGYKDNWANALVAFNEKNAKLMKEKEAAQKVENKTLAKEIGIGILGILAVGLAGSALTSSKRTAVSKQNISVNIEEAVSVNS